MSVCLSRSVPDLTIGRGQAVLLAFCLWAIAACAPAVVVPSTAPPSVASASVSPMPSPSPTTSPIPSPSPSPSPTPSPTPQPTATPSPTPQPTPGLVPAALTGELVTPEAAARHPIAVMIDDLAAARPQSGLTEADVVWHAPAEGGVPRYMAIFQSRMRTAIGPVRSARVYFVQWAAEWRAVYVHSGGSPKALALLRAKGGGSYVYDANEYAHGGSFHRISSRRAPHNLYTDAAQLRRLGRRLGATDPALEAVWTFAPDAPLESRPTGGRIKVAYRFNTIVYRYDRTTNTYRRSVTSDSPQVDAADGQQVAPKNVIVMSVTFIPTNDHKFRLEGEVVGSGRATISTGGRTLSGTWRKDSDRAPTLFFDASGRPVTLTVGQTFIQVIPIGLKASYTPGTEPGAVPSGAPSPAPTPSP